MRFGVFLAALTTSAVVGSAAAIAEMPTVAPHDKVKVGPPMCEPTDFKIYFERGDARITKPAERTLDVVTSHMRGCDIVSVKLQAEAATIANEKGRRIAGERGARILSALRERGVSSDTILVTAQGSPLEPASAAPDHLTVVVHAAPPSVSARRRAAGETDA